MEALLPLLAGIVRRYNVAPANVVGHSDVAPARKEDPGELFDWALLARHGSPSRGPPRGWSIRTGPTAVSSSRWSAGAMTFAPATRR